MPGIQPASRKQVKLAFALERRGQFKATPKTPWTSEEAKRIGSLAREWGHRWKCWEWDEKVRGKMPADCKSALQLLDKLRSEHPTWKVPEGVTRPAPRPKVVPIRRPERELPPPITRPIPVAARIARAKPVRVRSGVPTAARPKPRALPGKATKVSTRKLLVAASKAPAVLATAPSRTSLSTDADWDAFIQSTIQHATRRATTKKFR